MLIGETVRQRASLLIQLALWIFLIVYLLFSIIGQEEDNALRKRTWR